MKITKARLKEIIEEELTAQQRAARHSPMIAALSMGKESEPEQPAGDYPKMQALLGPELYGRVMAEFEKATSLAKANADQRDSRYYGYDLRFADALEAVLPEAK